MTRCPACGQPGEHLICARCGGIVGSPEAEAIKTSVFAQQTLVRRLTQRIRELMDAGTETGAATTLALMEIAEKLDKGVMIE